MICGHSQPILTLAAGEQRAPEKMASYFKLFGWLQSASIRAMEAAGQIQDDAPQSLDDLLGKRVIDAD